MRSGEWRKGFYLGEGTQPYQWEQKVEQALYLQPQLLQQTFSSLLKSDNEAINLYFVGIGGDGKQHIFYREVSYIRDLFDHAFNTKGRSVILANNALTVERQPLATVSSIEKTLHALAQKMDVDNDILFLYFSSHGSKTLELTLDQNGMDLPDLSAEKLAAILADLPIRWKVLVVLQ